MRNPLYKSEEGERAVMAVYEQVLSRWPMPTEQLRVPTRHGDTFVIACGDPSAPPLVLLHGSTSNAVFWLSDAAAYYRHFRVYALDLPGEPGRSAPNRPPFEGPAWVEWLEDVLEALHVDQVTLLGLSMGGFIALRFATLHPERVSRLVLLAPGGVVYPRLSFVLRAVLLTAFGRKGAEAINRMLFGKQPIHPEALEFMNLIFTHFRARVAKIPLFTDGELQGLTMPVLLVAGGQDAILPTEKMAERLQRLVPHAATRFLPDVGHVLANLTGEILPFLVPQSKVLQKS